MKICQKQIFFFFFTLNLSFLLTSVSKSDEESVEEVGETVSIVLNDIDPEKSPFLGSPTRTFKGCKPRGQPSSYNQIGQNIIQNPSTSLDKKKRR